MLSGVFHDALLRPNCCVTERFYRTRSGARYSFVSIGNIGPQGTITKSKLTPEIYEIGGLPESNYAPANLRLSDIELGIIKYFKPVKHWTLEDLYSDVCFEFSLPVTPYELSQSVFAEFSSYFPGLNVYLAQKMPFSSVLKYMTHDISGALRKKTSAGLGFKHDRKYIARNFVEDVRSCYELDTFDFDTYWKMFLKDELREKLKDTRSIAVAPLTLWVICMTYLGAIYEWLADYSPAWTGYGMDNRCLTWHEKLQYFDGKSATYGFDIRQQDSKMSPGFVEFIVLFFKSVSPVNHWGAIEWYFEQTFFSKKLVDARGNILMFSNGQPSGNALTIVLNTMHNLYTHVLHLNVARLHKLVSIDSAGRDVGECFILLGDDTIMQTASPDLYKRVCMCLGHETTTESGTLFDVSFLSMKITLYKGQYAPYYCNMDKMFASLRYTTSGEEEYFQKLCSFYSMLIYAPKNSVEEEWKKRIEAHIYYFIQCDLIRPEYLACFKPSHLQKRERSGMTYHSCAPGSVGGLKVLNFNRMSSTQQNPTKAMKRRKAKQQQKRNKAQAKSEPKESNLGKVHHSINPKRKQKMKNTALAVTRQGLSSAEAKWAKEYVLQLLWPTKPLKLVRPIPVRSFPYFKRGEIIFTSANKYTEVQFRPNPWRFIELKEDVASSTVNFTDNQYVTSYNKADDQQFTLLNGTTHYLSFANNLSTTDGTIIQYETKDQPAGATNYVCVLNGDEVTNGLNGYSSMTCAGQLVGSIRNNTPRSLTVAFDVVIQNSDESIATTISGGTSTVLSGQILGITSASLSGVSCSSTQNFVPLVRVVNGSGFSVFLKDLEISLGAPTQPLIQTAAAVTKVYTFGSALYPSNDELAAKVMEAFSESQLWSPVAMACLYNVTQELAKAGGKFSSSYLPSFVSGQIPEDFEEAWQTLATWATSYPHYEGDFVTGAHASWIGARILDYEFLRPYQRDQVLDYEAISLPSDVFMSNSAAQTSSFTYYITFAAAFEIQTLSPNFTCTLGPASTLLMPQFLSLAAASNDLVGENPSHMKRLKSLANKIFSDPTVQQGFKTLAGAGLSALMMA